MGLFFRGFVGEVEEVLLDHRAVFLRVFFAERLLDGFAFAWWKSEEAGLFNRGLTRLALHGFGVAGLVAVGAFRRAVAGFGIRPGAFALAFSLPLSFSLALTLSFTLPLPFALSLSLPFALSLSLTLALPGLLRNAGLLRGGHACCLRERLRGLLGGLLRGGGLSALRLRCRVGKLLRGLLRRFLRGG